MAAALAAIAKARENEKDAAERIAKAENDMRVAFEKTDKDGSGELEVDEMLAALQRIQFYVPNSPTAKGVVQKVKKAAGADQKFSFDEYKAFIEKMRKDKDKWKTPVSWLPYNREVFAFYQLNVVQLFIAAVIIINFLTIVIMVETDPYKPDIQNYYASVWQPIDNVCNVIFVIELAINVYGSWWRPFVREPWNYLDTIIVVVGIFSLANAEMGPLANLKVLRAFRILRLFKRVESLNKILVGLARSIPGVVNAFVVMFIFMAIYAVLAVDLFREFGEEGTYETIQRYGPSDATWGEGEAYALADAAADPKLRIEQRVEVSAMTARGFHFGQEYFGTFSRALYTLFQVLTGESWSEAVARPLIFGHPPEIAIVAGVFFTSFILLTAIILQNVVVTVLLDKFLSTDTETKAEDKDADANMANAMAGSDGPAAAPPAATASGSAPSADGASSAELVALRKQANSMQAELDATLKQVTEILKLLPAGAG